MLGKLIKHEFRATARLMLPLFLVVILLSCFMRLTSSILESGSHHSFALRLVSGLFTAGFVLSTIVALVFAVVLMVSRFYKNLMTDEGYLMFTLPVSIHQLIWSKLIVSTVWFLATILADMLGVLIASYQSGMLYDIMTGFGNFFRELAHFYGFNGAGFALEALAILLLSLIVSCLNFYAPIAVGHSFSGHKILLSVVFYFVFSIAWQIVGLTGMFSGVELLSTRAPLMLDTTEAVLRTAHYSMLAAIGALAFVGAVMYVITWLMLKKRLNLQ